MTVLLVECCDVVVGGRMYGGSCHLCLTIVSLSVAFVPSFARCCPVPTSWAPSFSLSAQCNDMSECVISILCAALVGCHLFVSTVSILISLRSELILS